MKFYTVGGAVRDELLGIPSKDVDFAVEAESFEALRVELVRQGFKIHVEKPEFLTIRAGVPLNHSLRSTTKDADFVLCRKDSPTSDGRRPDSVTPGTILDDLSRRDFSINAIARDPETGDYIDPHGGIMDLGYKILRFVGDPNERIREDGLRVLRGFRFMVTKDLVPEIHTLNALLSPLAKEMLADIPKDRVFGELNKMFRHDTIATLELLNHTMRPEMLEVIFNNGLRLDATMAQ
jgi:tRNA nucleotidyltransferase (CCA-adding enzyme)